MFKILTLNNISPAGLDHFPRDDYEVASEIQHPDAILLGSQQAYLREFRDKPGTYYLTKGWLECEGHPLGEYRECVERYGHERADHIVDIGPGAGSQGGAIVAQGPLSAIMAAADSYTGAMLRELFAGASS